MGTNLLDKNELFAVSSMGCIQQDGAPSHGGLTSENVFASKFPTRWCNRWDGSNSQPPNFPNTTPLEFIYWGLCEGLGTQYECQLCNANFTHESLTHLLLETSGAGKRVEWNLSTIWIFCRIQNGMKTDALKYSNCYLMQCKLFLKVCWTWWSIYVTLYQYTSGRERDFLTRSKTFNVLIRTLHNTQKKKNSMVWVRKRTIPTEWPPLVGELISNFLRIEGATWSAWQIPTAVFSVC
jgi:hypothetical protein